MKRLYIRPEAEFYSFRIDAPFLNGSNEGDLGNKGDEGDVRRRYSVDMEESGRGGSNSRGGNNGWGSLW